MTRTSLAPAMLATILAIGGVAAAGCSSDADSTSGSADSSQSAPAGEAVEFVSTIAAAIEAVESELGGPQQFFEVTANAQFTNIFVAIDDATAAVPYLYVDGVLEAPGPRQDGASGRTFTSAEVDFDPALVLSGVQNDLSDSSIDAISVYGNGIGAVYIVGVTSAAGGLLDVEVGPTGQVFSVDPV